MTATGRGKPRGGLHGLAARMLYTFQMKKESIDISRYSFDEFVTFLFDREVPSETAKRDPWYWHTGVAYVPETICSYYLRLFQQPQFLGARFSKPQLEQAFWAIPSDNLDCSAARIMRDSDLPFAARAECVKAMADLFRNLFATEPLETSVQMWWDVLCYDWECGNRQRERGGEDEQMQDVIFQTLTSILEIDSDICQGAALHGLGHLHHPETENLIQRFIALHPTLTKGQRDYAIAAAKFQVL
jgi:hypothetical protein